VLSQPVADMAAVLVSQQRALGGRCGIVPGSHRSRPARCRLAPIQAEKQPAPSMPSGSELLSSLAPQLAPPPGVRMPGTSKLVDESQAYQTAAVVAFSSYLLSTVSTLAGEIRPAQLGSCAAVHC
jgi:hypothetical protein